MNEIKKIEDWLEHTSVTLGLFYERTNIIRDFDLLNNSIEKGKVKAFHINQPKVESTKCIYSIGA